MAGIFGELYSNNGGTTWANSRGGGGTRSVHPFANDNTGKKFGLSGVFGGKQGVAVSSDGGVSFKRYPINALFTEARYGAFPSATTWYVAAGEWPEDAAQPARNPRRKSIFQDKDGHFPRAFKRTPLPKLGGNMTGYMAQIVKTTDGGNTWTTLFAENKCDAVTSRVYLI